MYTIQGLENVDYTNKNGARITGTKLHLSFESEKVKGTGVEVVFIGNSVDCSNLSVGDNVKLFYNRFGKVSEVSLA